MSQRLVASEADTRSIAASNGEPVAALERLRTRLLDLTLANRLLNFKQVGARVVRVIDELPDQLFDRLRAGAELELLPVPAPPPDHPFAPRATALAKAARLAAASTYAEEVGLVTSYDLPPPISGSTATKHDDDAIQTLLFPEDLEKALRTIASDARSALEEKGSNILYMIFGFLEWYEAESSEKAIMSPLVLLPVSVRRGEPDRRTGAYRFFLSYSNEDVLPNISLQEKLRRDFRLTLPDLEDDDSPEKYFERIASKVPLLPRWTIRRQISLGLVAFSKLFMYRDLDPEVWPQGEGPAEHERVVELLGAATPSDAPHTGEYDFEDGGAGPTPKIVPPLVMDADSSQHSAIVDALVGSTVIEGPPGTGKSQTIANLIAAAMDEGKTVLFVAEKLTALEVVKRRLDDTGLGAFCLELHSDKTQKSRMMDDLNRRLELRNTFRAPAEIESRARVLRSLKQRLNSYARRVNAPVGAMEWTVHDVLWGTQRRRSTLGVHGELWKTIALPGAETLALEGYEELRRCAAIFGDALGRLRRSGPLWRHPFWGIWSGRTDPAFETVLMETLKRLQVACREASTQLDTASSEIGWTCLPSVDFLEASTARAQVLHAAAHLSVTSTVRLLTTSAARTDLARWLDELVGFHDAKKRLEQLGVDTDTQKALSELTLDTFAKLEPSFRLADVARASELAAHAVSELRAASTVIRDLAAAVGASLPSTMAAARMARDVIACASAAPFELLSYRLRSDGEADATLLESGRRRAEELRREQAALEERFDFALLPDSPVLEQHAAVCASAGFFSFLSRDYRAAKRQYSVLARHRAKWTAADMAAGFRALALQQKNRSSFNSDLRLRDMLGTRFNGLDTDFEAIASACAWQRQALALQRRHRQMFPQSVSMADAPIEVLQDVAALAVGSSSGANPATHIRELLASRADVVDIDGTPVLELEQHVKEAIRSLESLNSIVLRLAERGPSTIGELATLAKEQHTLAAIQGRLEVAEHPRAILGEHFAGIATAANVVRATLDYATAVFHPDTPEFLRNYLSTQPASALNARLVPLLTKAKQALLTMYAVEDTFCATGEVVVSHWYGSDDSGRAPDQVLGRTERALKEHHALPAWIAYLRARLALYNAGGDSIRELAERDDRIDLATLTTAAEYTVYSTIAAKVFANDPELAQHDGIGHDALREQFRRYDEQLLQLERERIAARIDAKPVPEGVRAPLVKHLTDLALLEHEVRKQRAHVPIRQLVNRAGNALRALKPCFMMSPRSVAQYLEAGKHAFDLVVMDEASQLRPEDAIGAVVRGKQVVIVGDSKQLPPTSFFSGDMLDEADADGTEKDEEAITDGKESILDLARTVFRSVRRLRWHYRSRHGSLIAFSNDRYYDGNLIVFPSVQDATDDLGVRLVHVTDATYADGQNLDEAKAVVDAVMDHLQTCPDATLGIVALNIRQKTLIQNLLYDRLKDEPELRERFERTGQTDGGFIKNLESVQGDERDVIYISVTYGPSVPGGTVARRFGPINSENGWRRLNVLFTRARRRVVVFASFLPEQLGDDGLSRGAKDLRDYIAFARVGRYQESHGSSREPDSDFEVEVANTLRDAGYSVSSQVGVAGYFIDLAVRSQNRDGRYLLGIECDGAPYHSSFSARDRDRLRQQVLERLGWRIYRIWSTDWYRDPSAQSQRLVEAVKAAVQA